MTVASEKSMSGPYLCNGVTKNFDYQFKVFSADHLSVVLHEADGGRAIAGYNLDYTVTGIGNDGGGQVVMNVAPQAGQQLTITRNVPFTQEVDLENQGAFYIEVIERAFDEAAIRDQQLKEQLGRAVVVGENTDISAKDALVRDITKLAEQSADISELVAMKAAIEEVREMKLAVNTVAGKAGDITAVAQIAGDVTTVKGMGASINTVKNMQTNITTVAGNQANITAVALNSANINTVAGISTSVNEVAQKTQDITTVAGMDISGVMAAADYAHQWAAKAENDKVNDGANPEGYSAYHWAQKAQASAAAASSIAGGDFLPLTGGTVTGAVTVSAKLTANEIEVGQGTGKATYAYNGIPTGTGWKVWHDSGNAFSAIDARIEARALAIANARINALVNGMIDTKLDAFMASNPIFDNGLRVSGMIKATGDVKGYSLL